MDRPKDFFDSLFDFSFTSFITSRLIKVLYGLSIAGAGLSSLSLIMTGFRDSVETGFWMLFIVAPLVFLFSVVFTRIILELIIVIFRISEHTAEIAEQGRRSPLPPRTE